MHRVHDALRFLFEKNKSVRETSRLTGLSRTAITNYLDNFAASGLTWPEVKIFDYEKLNLVLNIQATPAKPHRSKIIDFATVHEELKQKGATLTVLYDEWLQVTPIEFHISYSQYCRGYRAHKKSLRLSMRQTHIYGEAVYVDYAGKTMPIFNRNTGEERHAQIFVGALGGSGLGFAEATWTQTMRDWNESHCRMFEYFEGVPRVIVHDNLKSAVTKADRLSPIINETYLNMCRHYGAYPFAARAYHPRDKPKAEATVALVTRWILFRLRKHKFFSLSDLNLEIGNLLKQMNHKPFQKKLGSRYEAWVNHEKSTLQPLPNTRFEFAEFGVVRADIAYHVLVDKHFYSVPYKLRGKEFHFRLTAVALELLQKGVCVVTHTRSFVDDEKTTLDLHRPPEHNAVANWSKDEALQWAAEVGESTAAFLKNNLEKAGNYYFGYRAANALKKLHKKFGGLRLEQACRYALIHKATTSGRLQIILQGNLDQLLVTEATTKLGESEVSSQHHNIRGADYYAEYIQSKEEEAT